MAFEITVAYGISVATATLLGYMAIRNRRAGWVRERQNVILDVFMTWARVRSQMTKALDIPAQLPATPGNPSVQLIALHEAIQVNAGAAPAEHPDQAESGTVKSNAARYAQCPRV